jgi:hypothetical protein
MLGEDRVKEVLRLLALIYMLFATPSVLFTGY